MKGISPIVAVVLLIAIAVIAAVGLYFWVGGLATQQPTTAKPGVISANCAGGTILVSNIGTASMNASSLLSTGAAVATVGGTNSCISALKATNPILSGGTCVYGTATGSGTIYAPAIGSAGYNC
jgi:flagellin-like protein